MDRKSRASEAVRVLPDMGLYMTPAPHTAAPRLQDGQLAHLPLGDRNRVSDH